MSARPDSAGSVRLPVDGVFGQQQFSDQNPGEGSDFANEQSVASHSPGHYIAGMTGADVARICPSCGARLELMPDHTCKWCHASIEEARVVPVGLTPEQVAALSLRERVAEIGKLSQCRDWTLPARPGQSYPIDWGQLADMTQPAQDLLTAFQAFQSGQAGPGVVALAQQSDAEIQTVWLIGEVMLAGSIPTTTATSNSSTSCATYSTRSRSTRVPTRHGPNLRGSARKALARWTDRSGTTLSRNSGSTRSQTPCAPGSVNNADPPRVSATTSGRAGPRPACSRLRQRLGGNRSRLAVRVAVRWRTTAPSAAATRAPAPNKCEPGVRQRCRRPRRSGQRSAPNRERDSPRRHHRSAHAGCCDQLHGAVARR